jgi:hypothetical protein
MAMTQPKTTLIRGQYARLPYRSSPAPRSTLPRMPRWRQEFLWDDLRVGRTDWIDNSSLNPTCVSWLRWLRWLPNSSKLQRWASLYRSPVSVAIARTSSLLAFAVATLFAINAPCHAACNIINGKAYGDCAGVRINEGIKRRLTVRSYTTESGFIAGANILKGGELALSGISNGDITVQEGGRLVLTGMVEGTVKNLGGSVEIEGMLDHLYTTGGSVVIGGTVGTVSGAGRIRYRKGAVVGGVPVQKTVETGGKQ